MTNKHLISEKEYKEIQDKALSKDLESKLSTHIPLDVVRESLRGVGCTEDSIDYAIDSITNNVDFKHEFSRTDNYISKKTEEFESFMMTYVNMLKGMHNNFKDYKFSTESKYDLGKYKDYIDTTISFNPYYTWIDVLFLSKNSHMLKINNSYYDQNESLPLELFAFRYRPYTTIEKGLFFKKKYSEKRDLNLAYNFNNTLIDSNFKNSYSEDGHVLCSDKPNTTFKAMFLDIASRMADPEHKGYRIIWDLVNDIPQKLAGYMNGSSVFRTK